eukprot:3933380-Rhodomonas_salina.1
MLEARGLRRYVAVFEEHELYGDELGTVTDRDMEEDMGITNAGHRCAEASAAREARLAVLLAAVWGMLAIRAAAMRALPVGAAKKLCTHALLTIMLSGMLTGVLTGALTCCPTLRRAGSRFSKPSATSSTACLRPRHLPPRRRRAAKTRRREGGRAAGAWSMRQRRGQAAGAGGRPTTAARAGCGRGR